MRWNVFGNGRLAVVLFAAVVIGCRARNEPVDPDQTIVVRRAARLPERRGHDMGDRVPNRIEVVVAAEPRDSGGSDGSPPLASLVGRHVKVQLRRDALGLAATANAPIPLTSPGSGGRAVSVIGTVRAVRGGWIVLEREKVSWWIPQAAILLIETADAPATSPVTD